MFATTEKVKIGGKDILCMDLTYGYIIDIDNGTIEDSILNAVENGTQLEIDDIKALRKNEVEVLYDTIMRLSYPTLYDEDGQRINIDGEEEEDIKKKV